MATQVQWRGGSTAEHATFTGAAREVTVDTQKQTLVLHDGSTAGGRPLLREDGSNAALALGSAGTPSLKFTGDINTGIYSPGADQVSLTTGGTERLRIDSTGQIEAVSLGTAAAPVFSFTGDPNTGLYSPGADQLALSTAGIGRLFVDSAGLVGIGTTSPVVPLHLVSNAGLNTPVELFRAGSEGASLRLSITPASAGDVVSEIYAFSGGAGNSSSSALAFKTRLAGVESERARIDSSGRLLVGTSAQRAIEPYGVSAAGTNGGHVFEQTQTAGQVGIACVNNSDTNASYGSYIYLARTRGSSINANTIVLNGDNLGTISFAGADGTDIRTKAAAIYAEVDGTPGLNDMPGRLVFSTTADGASTPTPRATIDSSGKLLVGTTSAVTTSYSSGLIQLATPTGGIIVTSRDDSTVGNSIVIGGLSLWSKTTTNHEECASIFAQADGTYADGDKPTRLVFSTTADGAASPTERVRLTNTGALLVGTTATPTGASAGSITAENKIIVSSTSAGREQIIAGAIGTVTATTGTTVFTFSTTAPASATAGFVKLSVHHRASSNTPSNSPAAEYWFNLHNAASGACTINGTASIYEYTYVRATHFAFDDLGGGQCTITLTNPTGSTLAAGSYKVEILTAQGFWTLNSVSST